MDDSEEDFGLQCPVTEMTSTDFEQFVLAHFASQPEGVDKLECTWNQRMTSSDGVYQIDGTVQFEFAGAHYLTLVEAKLHRNPIKRELVVILKDKKQSLGAHKAIMASTAPFQSGAVQYAKEHGIALIHVVEGRFAYISNGIGIEARPAPEYVAQHVEYWPATGHLIPMNLPRAGDPTPFLFGQMPSLRSSVEES